MKTAAFAVLASVCALAAAVPFASADADPASDYLIGRPVYVTRLAGTPHASALNAYVSKARKAGVPVKVAVIGAPEDLGALTVLFRKPQAYAKFLTEELRYWYHGDVLVVMPNGYGIYRVTPKVPTADAALIAGLKPPNTENGDKLVESAGAAVQALAKRQGITLAPMPRATSSASTDRLTIIIAAAVLVLLGGGLVLLVRHVKRVHRRGNG